MNKEYGKTNENLDFEMLEHFNSLLKLKDLGRCPEMYHTDASGYSNNKYINIELKRRSVNLNTYKTLYIEAHKAGDLLLDYVIEGKIPLYINFLQDGHVVVFNLAELKHRPEKIAKRIESKLYEGFELAKREELLIEDAWIYKLENNQYKLIHKP